MTINSRYAIVSRSDHPTLAINRVSSRSNTTLWSFMNWKLSLWLERDVCSPFRIQTIVSLLPCRFTRSRMNILVTDWTIWRPNSAHFGCSQTHGFIEISTTKLTGFWAQSTWRWQNVNECGLLMRRVMTHYSRFKQLRQARIYAILRVKLSLKWGELCVKKPPQFPNLSKRSLGVKQTVEED